MAKISLPTVTNGNNISTLNSNFSKIADALNNSVLYRKNPVGEPNQLLNDLDINGHSLLNVGQVDADKIVLAGTDIQDTLDNSVSQSATYAQLAQNSAASAAASASQAARQWTIALNVNDFGASTSATDNTAAFNAWWTAVKVQKRAGYIPTGRYRFTQALTLDMAGLADTGVKIFGDGQHSSILDFSAVGSGTALFLTMSDNGGACFYSSFRDFGVQGNTSGILVQLGKQDFSDAINSFEFSNLWLGNNYASGSPIVLQLNYVLASKFDNVVAAGNHTGSSVQLRAAAFCTFIGGAATWGNIGMEMPTAGFGTVAGNNFIGMDFEENLSVHVQITSVNAHDNVWRGGTFVYNIGTQYGVNATAGSRNVFEGIFTNTTNGTAAFGNFCNASAGVGFDKSFGLMSNLNPGNPSFSAYLTANQSLSAGTWTKVAFNATHYQNNNGFNTATGRFTAPVPGLYRFNGVAVVNATNASNNTGYAALYQNGSNVRAQGYGIPSGTNFIGLGVDALLVMSVNDYVEFWTNIPATSGTPSIGSGATNSYFNCQFIG